MDHTATPCAQTETKTETKTGLIKLYIEIKDTLNAETKSKRAEQV